MLRENSFGVSLQSPENTRIRCALIHEKNLYGLRDHLVQTFCFTNAETGLEVKVRLMFKEG